MSVLVVGISHASAPMATLERAVVTGDAQTKLLHDLRLSDHVAGSLLLSTCNRVEVYAEVEKFHGGVAAICELLARHSGLQLDELTGYAYVHYAERAVQHLLSVACGLESVVVGESQILGQVRQAIRLARQHGTLSRELSELGRLALRTGKRARAETGIDAAGQSMVTLGVYLASRLLGGGSGVAGEPGSDSMAGRRVLVVGAGSMSSIAVATAVRHGAADVVVANRTRAHAERLAKRYGVASASLAELPAAIAAADLVIACTGAATSVITVAMVADALQAKRAAEAEFAGRVPAGQRGADEEPHAPRSLIVLVDLGLPRNVDVAAGQLTGVRLVDLETMRASRTTGQAGSSAALDLADDAEVAAVRRIVTQELAGYLKADRAASVAPTVVALRAKAATVVESELARLERRLGDVDTRTRREIAQSMGRIADKLLHGPTVRVKELVGAPGAESYETALRVLFELDPEVVQSVGRPAESAQAESQQEVDA